MTTVINNRVTLKSIDIAIKYEVSTCLRLLREFSLECKNDQMMNQHRSADCDVTRNRKSRYFLDTFSMNRNFVKMNIICRTTKFITT